MEGSVNAPGLPAARVSNAAVGNTKGDGSLVVVVAPEMPPLHLDGDNSELSSCDQRKVKKKKKQKKERKKEKER